MDNKENCNLDNGSNDATVQRKEKVVLDIDHSSVDENIPSEHHKSHHHSSHHSHHGSHHGKHRGGHHKSHKHNSKKKFKFTSKLSGGIIVSSFILLMALMVFTILLDMELLDKPNRDDGTLNQQSNTTILQGISIENVFAPSTQLPADGSERADFDAENIDCEDIYSYIDELVEKYPNYITKEVLGKDQSGLYDWNRYILCKRYYDAWCKENYPKMWAWVNGSTTIYSLSISPRIGDLMYSTPYIGTSTGIVSDVNNIDQTRTVNGTIYVRDEKQDVEPTLVYTKTTYSPYYVSLGDDSVYDVSRIAIGTIAEWNSNYLIDSNDDVYVRYPLGDRNSDFKCPDVIIIGSNEHGRPQDSAEPAIISARMIKDLCENANINNQFLNLLKNNYMIIFCPVINPYGFSEDHQSYYNANGVNLDRNYDTPGWGNDLQSGYQGEYGGSENETQYMMNTISESGAKYIIVNHGLGVKIDSVTNEDINAGLCHWMLGRNNSKYDRYLDEIKMTMLSNYNLVFTDYGEAPPETHAKTRSYISFVGANGGGIEMQAREGFILAGNSQLHTSKILEANYTLLLQFLYMIIVCA